MPTCSSFIKRITLRLLFIFVSALIINCYGINNQFITKQKNFCPFVETLSFGSDIDIKCNDTYLIFNEINNNSLNWKFANQNSICHQHGKQQASINQCNLTRIDSKYLKVPLRSLDHNENACVYCQINYKPIAPMITVTQSDDAHYILYTFNITAVGLAHHESFEILWVKRASYQIRNSFNYWFLQGCIDPMVEILENSGHTIIFTIDDTVISRVKFIIRYCNGTCRNYRQCDEEEFFDEISLNNFQVPDSIEKISCNYECLNGIVSTTTMNNMIKEDFLLSTIRLSNKKQTIKTLILFPTLILFIILAFCIILRMKDLRKRHVYTKPDHINLNEHK